MGDALNRSRKNRKVGWWRNNGGRGVFRSVLAKCLEFLQEVEGRMAVGSKRGVTGDTQTGGIRLQRTR